MRGQFKLDSAKFSRLRRISPHEMGRILTSSIALDENEDSSKFDETEPENDVETAINRFSEGEKKHPVIDDLVSTAMINKISCQDPTSYENLIACPGVACTFTENITNWKLANTDESASDTALNSSSYDDKLLNINCTSDPDADFSSDSGSNLGYIILSCPVRLIDSKDGINACSVDGKTALSGFRPIGYDLKSDTTLVECCPLTGRTVRSST